MTEMRAELRRQCRVCGSTNLFPYLDFGLQPLANALRDPASDARETRFSLALRACQTCKLSQLSHVVPASVLYADYPFQSGVSAGWRAHCDALAARYARPELRVLDIAANDGTLVQAFLRRACFVLGVEPSLSFAQHDYPKLPMWWTCDTVKMSQKIGWADLITAQNVLGHVDDVHEFVEAIRLALAPDGSALVEVPYLPALFKSLAFDTIYHEHVSYWTVTALRRLVSQHNLVLQHIERIPTHGGSIRATLAHAGVPDVTVTDALVSEISTLKRADYLTFSSRVSRRIADINSTLVQYAPDYVGFGAAAKATVMLGVLDPRAHPAIVYDETPTKQGKQIPGTRVDIEAPPHNWRNVRGPVCVFAWNYATDIVARLRREGFAGDIFIPLPVPRWDSIS